MVGDRGADARHPQGRRLRPPGRRPARNRRRDPARRRARRGRGRGRPSAGAPRNGTCRRTSRRSEEPAPRRRSRATLEQQEDADEQPLDGCLRRLAGRPETSGGHAVMQVLGARGSNQDRVDAPTRRRRTCSPAATTGARSTSPRWIDARQCRAERRGASRGAAAERQRAGRPRRLSLPASGAHRVERARAELRPPPRRAAPHPERRVS